MGEDKPRFDAGLPTSATELGDALRSLRTVSLDVLIAKAQPRLSKAQLSRYERGETRPPLKHARHLDDLYDASGWVENAVNSLWRRDWNPWFEGDAVPRRTHAVCWPAGYEGLVWMKVVPMAHAVGTAHHLRLDWGPWRYDDTVDLPASGLLLATGKARDDAGVAVVLNIDVTPAAFLLHGAGEDLDAEVRDIRSDWIRKGPGRT